MHPASKQRNDEQGKQVEVKAEAQLIELNFSVQ
jgi:hypothetical protein